MRFKIISDVHFLLFREDTVLLHQRKNTGYMDGWYSVPGGHIEDNEPASHALCREVFEETGIFLSPDQVKPVHIMHRKSNDIRFTTFWSAIGEVTQTPQNMEPQKSDDVRFFPLHSLPSNLVPYVRFTIDQVLEGKFYSEFGWEE